MVFWLVGICIDDKIMQTIFLHYKSCSLKSFQNVTLKKQTIDESVRTAQFMQKYLQRKKMPYTQFGRNIMCCIISMRNHIHHKFANSKSKYHLKLFKKRKSIFFYSKLFNDYDKHNNIDVTLFLVIRWRSHHT